MRKQALGMRQQATVRRNRKKSLHLFYCLLPVACCLFFLGCSLERRFIPTPSAEELQLEAERLGELPVARRTRVPASTGSLWPRDDQVFFYADKKANRVGDILTIKVVEASQASNAADTDLSRKSSINGRIDNFFTAKKLFGVPLSQNFAEASAENAHLGKGSTTREGKVTANITTVVTRVLPNGNLVIKGMRAVGVNNEEQHITLTGIVRQEDIARDNTVSSTQIADAHITLSGAGVVADKQRSGWGTWIFDWIWPF
jgi:flagellar L-ring protein precursor FlgH